ncbi:hypothetical protein GWI72_16815 [Microvirga tunisiensis]|uniref:CheW-like domain-containing protein n=1 Tax=Pannonibacter tanglangensis TaxID=2750084 RepID=A0A7X5F563_9HYPH|nr:hypothetical protein [Pannonibacter sp. XCT-53]NBN79941.1 hypothetical protein [Pannonibacter sp. XCT-53]
MSQGTLAGNTDYLRVHAGGTTLLVPRTRVASVQGLTGEVRSLAPSQAPSQALSRRLDRSALVVDLARLLHLPSRLPPHPVGLRLVCGTAAWLCLVERVDRIESHPRSSLRPLPRALAPLTRWLDGVIAEESTGTLVCVLRDMPDLPGTATLRRLRRAAVDATHLREDAQ